MNLQVDLQLLAVLLAGGALAVSTAVLFVGWRILRSTRRSDMHQEREMLQEELKRLLSAMDEEDEDDRA